MNRYVRSLLSPRKALAEFGATLAPELYWSRVNSLARARGFQKLYLCLSFDCDTDLDAEVVGQVHSRLRDIGITPTYAVPAELLKQQGEAYSKIRDNGATFLNHGYKVHTLYDEASNRYESCLSYDAIHRDEVVQDIRLGHEILSEFLGNPPKGFRTPHFGTFQKTSDLRFLHSFLKSLGYFYSSSTLPVYSALEGPLFDKFGLWEIPVLGTASQPRKIFDSWSFFYAPSRKWKTGDYYREARFLVDLIKRKNLVGLLNCYADPSQVFQREEFFDSMALLSKHAESLNLDLAFSIPRLDQKGIVLKARRPVFE